MAKLAIKRHPELFNPITEIYQNRAADVISISEVERQALLEKARLSGCKLNILNDCLSAPENERLQALTRGKYQTMPSVQIALKRLGFALDEVFSREESSNLKALAQHVIGYYLNTNQYHNAFHVLCMTVESINICRILGVKDMDVVKAIVIAGLYHDAGNGEYPVAPDRADCDEVQACQILNRDYREAKRMQNLAGTSSHLTALLGLENKKISFPIPGKTKKSETCNLLELANACIAYTVFKDRFQGQSGFHMNETYIPQILQDLYQSSSVSAKQLKLFVALSESYMVWTSRNADIASSLEGLHGPQNSLASYAEDLRREGFKPGENQDMVQYRNGFLQFLFAGYERGDNDVIQKAKANNPCPFPTLDPQVEELYYSSQGLKELNKFINERIAEESRQFQRLQYGYGTLFVALFAIAAQEARTNGNIAWLPLKELAKRLRKWHGASLEKLKEILPLSQIDLWNPPVRNLNFSLNQLELLEHPNYANLTIADLSPAMFSSLFLPEIGQIRSLEDADRIIELKQAAEKIKITNPKSYYPLKFYLEDWNQTQEDLLKKYTQLKIPDGLSNLEKQRLIIKAWADLRREFSYQQILDLCEANILDQRIAGQSEAASYIQASLFTIFRDTYDQDLKPLISGVLSLASILPRSLRPLVLDPFQEIIAKGDKTNGIYILLEGQLEVLIGDKRIIVKPGQIVGEISMLTDTGAIATVRNAADLPALVAMVHETEVLAQYAGEDLRINLISLARQRLAGS